MTIREVHYQSIDEVVTAADRAWQARKRNSHFEVSHSRFKFFGIEYKSWEDVVGKARLVWPEGVSIVEEMIRELEGAELPKPKNRRRRMRWNEDGGDELDLDRLRAGHAWWRDMVRENVTGPQTLTIVCNISGPWFRTTEELLWRGAVSVALSNILEAAGYRVEMYACLWAREVWPGEGLFQTCLVKRAEQPTDVATLVNAVAPWMYRAFWFQSFHDLPSGGRRVNGSHGLYDHVISTKDVQVQRLIGNAASLIVDNVLTARAAIELARGVLTKLGQNSLA